MVVNDLKIKREDNKFTEYNPESDYTIKIPGLADAANDGLSDACRRVAKDGTNRQCEVLSLVDIETGKQKYYELGDYEQVGGEKFWSFIEDNPNGNFAFVHNHPTDSFLSSIDMQTFAGNTPIKLIIPTSNDGLKRIAHGNIKKPGVFFDVYYENDVKVLRDKLKNGTLDYPEYSFELEKLKVEKAINEFANLGFWEVDGRV